MKQQGFTLIELLVALVLVVIVSMMAAMGLQQLIKTDEHLRGINKNLSALNMTVWRFEHDVGQLQMRSILDGSGALQPPIVLNADSMTFTKAMMLPPGIHIGTMDMERVQYALQGNELVRITYPVMDRVANTPHETEVY